MRSMASSNSNKGIAAIVGVGPKLGRTIARKFAHEGYTVAILARDLGTLWSSTLSAPPVLATKKKKRKLKIIIIAKPEIARDRAARFSTDITAFCFCSPS